MNAEMSTIKEITWEEKNSTEPSKKLENNGVLDVCGIITNINEKYENKILNDITTEMAGIKRLEINTKYHREHSDKLKKERKEKFLENQRKKLEKLKTKNPPSRNCPSCNTKIYYVSIRNLNDSIKNNRVCKSCAFNKCHKNPPHNKGVYRRTENERKILKRNKQLKRNFGISEKEYMDMFNLQNGRCKICNIHKNELNENLCVDHCHTSNKIRGLLCRKCNAGIGIFKDDINIISSALKYLQSNK